MVRALLTALAFAALALPAISGTSAVVRADDSLPPPARPVVPGATPASPVPTPARPYPAPVPSPAPPPPAAPAPATGPSEYRLVAGDEVTIEVVLPSSVEVETGNLFRAPVKIVVANGGVVDLPKSPGVRLEARTRGEIRGDVQTNLRANGVSNQAEVLVNVTKYAPRYVFVVGSVNKTVEVSPFTRTTILQVFAHCGDTMKDADMRQVRVSSRGRLRTLDVRAVLLSGGTSPDAYVEADDVVIIDEKPAKPEPVIPSVYIGGFVRSPGAYRLYDSGQVNQPITILKAIFLAGGFAEYAYQDEVVLRRNVGGKIEQYKLDLEKVLKGKRGALNEDADVTLQQGDIIYVRGSG